MPEKGLQEGRKKALPLSSEPREASVMSLELGNGLTELGEGRKEGFFEPAGVALVCPLSVRKMLMSLGWEERGCTAIFV